jgi:eukaryotic-like serine/threonine-protein kinase
VPSCGDVSADSPSGFDGNALVGTILGEKYELLSLLGEGGMGAVYLGQHLLMRKKVAVKLLHPDMVGNAEIVARFEREAMAAAHIDHPNIAGATDFGRTDDGAFYLVLEYLEGESLRHVLEATPRLPMERALRISRQISLGLTRAHALGFVHRDLKPENVMIVQRDDAHEVVKVLDFGIAKLEEGGLAGVDGQPLSSGQPLTQQGMMYGTPEYMSPEQVRADQVDARADLYALGVMLFEMLAGVRPFQGETRIATVMQHLEAPVPSLRAAVPEVPENLDALVTSLLAKDIHDRPESAREVSKLLDEVAEAAGLTPASSLPPTTRGSLASAPASTARTAANSASDAMLATEAAFVPSFDRPAPPASTLPSAPTGPGMATVAMQSVGNLQSGLDPHIAPFRARLPDTLRTLPSAVLVGVPVAFVGLATVLGGILVLWGLFASNPLPTPDGDPPKPAETSSGAGAGAGAKPSTTATEAELAAAKADGAEKLRELAKKYPEDRRIWRPLLQALTSEKRHVEAMALLTDSVGNDPVVAAEDGVKQAVMAAIEGGGDGAEAAFVVLEGPLGESGANMLYDIATTRGGPHQARAWKALAKPEVQRAAPALAVVVELRQASSCGAKKALLPKVQAVGDKRVVSQLKALRATNGCGFLRRSDCWPCMRGDSALADALKAAEAR